MNSACLSTNRSMSQGQATRSTRGCSRVIHFIAVLQRRLPVGSIADVPERPATAGQIVILNGAPRSGKSSIVNAIQDSFDGPWMNLGVDVFVRHVTPRRYRPGMGLRPGEEGHAIAPLLPALYARSEEHTSELQSQSNLVCRLLLEKKKTHDPTLPRT